MTTASACTRALAVALEQRMDELGLDQRALARRAGVAPATVRQLQHGDARPHMPATLAKLSRALEWPADALVRLLSASDAPAAPGASSRAAPTYEPPAIEPTSILQRLVELEAEVAELRRLATAAVVDPHGGHGS
jgi:transcriptional regulator with XRE-family HTH domain